MLRTLLLERSDYDKPAVIEGERIVSYGELAERSNAVSAQLNALVVRSNVAILLSSASNYIAALFGALAQGHTAVPLSAALTASELNALLVQSDAAVLITERSFLSTIEQIANCPEAVFIDELPTRSGEPSEPVLPEPVVVDSDAPMIMLCTSGTTGGAKIVVLSENNVLSSVCHCMSKLDYERWRGLELRYVLGTPLCSAYGMFVLCVILTHGDAIVTVREPLLLSTFCEAVERRRVTHYEGGPALIMMMERELTRPSEFDLSSLRYLGFGGSGTPSEVVRNIIRAFPSVDVLSGYGLTETSPLIAKPFRRLPESKCASVGLPPSDCELMLEIDGIQTNTPLVRGEVVVRGSYVMLGYYKNPVATAETIRDGWLHTGDVGYLDADGYLYICGRIKNVILVRGFSVYPEEVEDCILSSGLVNDCRVFGESDTLSSERVCAEIVPSNDSVRISDIADWCRTHLATYKRPTRVTFVERIDKTSSGKTARANST